MASDKVEKEIKVPASGELKSLKIKIKLKFTKSELVKHLADNGQRESALCLQNWGELDHNAEQILKSMDAMLDKAEKSPLKPPMFSQPWKTPIPQSHPDHAIAVDHERKLLNNQQHSAARQWHAKYIDPKFKI